MGSYKASRIFNVPQTTPERYFKDQQKSSSETVKTKLGRKQVLRCEAENDLDKHCFLMKRKVLTFICLRATLLSYDVAHRAVRS
jgi:hypothetical protein